MDKFRCRICDRDFLSLSGLTRHANAIHHGRTSLSQTSQSQQSIPSPEHDSNLWNTPITRTSGSTSSSFAAEDSSSFLTESSDLWNTPITRPSGTTSSSFLEESSALRIDTADIMDEPPETEPRYYLRSQVELESEENTEDEEVETDLRTDLDYDFEPEDLEGASFDDALNIIEGRNRSEYMAEWPNDAYREFMELIIEGNISNKIGDKIIKFFNRHSNLQNSPLPSSTKNGKDYINQIKSPSLNFKEKVVASYNEVDFILYYRPIFRVIQALLQRPEVANNFVHRGIRKNDNNERIYGEPFECDWWLETEKDLPPLNGLLSIILYSDATNLDGLGKTSGHPVFLTLGNLPNKFRNSPEAKVLIGFLPRVQDSGIKTTESFKDLRRKVFHRCFNIMLRPLIEKSDGLYFGIKGEPVCFAAQISFFLSDMLEADEITATYKSARSKMPCHTCTVLQSDLNNMSIMLENMPLRTHESMQEVIRNGQEKNFSVHSVKNAFWKFP